MKLPLWMAGLFLAGAALLSWSPAAPSPAKQEIRIGTFDSRALAIAYANSALFQESMGARRQEHADAKARGDTETAQAIEAEMVALQEQLHGQGFSTAPIDNVLAVYPGDLAAIARAHGVCVLVSRWDLAWQEEQAPLVDLTDALVEPYQPSEKVRGWLKDLKNQAPIPLEDLKKMGDH